MENQNNTSNGFKFLNLKNFDSKKIFIGVLISFLLLVVGVIAWKSGFNLGDLSTRLIKDSGKQPDKLDFSDPGSDEVGQKIKTMDNVINEIHPSNYDEDKKE